MSTTLAEHSTPPAEPTRGPSDAAVHAPLGRVALGGLAAPAVIGVLFTVAAASQPAVDSDAGRSALLGLVAGLLGAAAGLAVMFAANPRPAVAWPMTTMFAGGVRLFGGLAAALPLYLVAGAEKLPFWGVFLAVALSAIIGEVATLSGFLRSLTPEARPSTPNPAEARSA